MIVTITVPDAVIRMASEQGMSVVEMVEQLMDRGLVGYEGRENVNSALDRIRALRTSPPAKR